MRVDLNILSKAMGIQVVDRDVQWGDLEDHYTPHVRSDPGWPHTIQPGYVAEIPPTLRARYEATGGGIAADCRGGRATTTPTTPTTPTTQYNGCGW